MSLSPTKLIKIFKAVLLRTNLNMSEGIPWLPWSVIAWLEQTLTPHMTVFEWGSGGSTLFIAQRVQRIISIEYDVVQYFVLRIHIALRRTKNIELWIIQPERGNNTSLYSSTHAKHLGEDYKQYCEIIDSYPDESFDVVLIDGRARVACIHHARQKVRVGGFLILDDSERAPYQQVLATLTHFERSEFYGTGPHLTTPHKTTIFKRVA